MEPSLWHRHCADCCGFADQHDHQAHRQTIQYCDLLSH
ncbi:Uncharacterised protein [Vibrio cholerae]|nr:Uncharacterised protein [Vibrio cholerae]CSI27076.1 Uncharacterised protein [Vibrio cholerae]